MRSFLSLLAIMLLCCMGSATRIVSLSPVATEFIFALGMGSQVVGVTTFCDRPAAAQKIAKIGGFADPQLESIVKLKPDLVVATPYGSAKSVVATLQERHIRVASGSVDTLTDAKTFLRTLAAATGRQKEAAELQKKIDAEYGSFKSRIKSSPKVLFLLATSPLVSAGPSTFLGQILSHIGGRNWTKGTALWPVISIEALMQDPPDVIVLTAGEKTLSAARQQLSTLLRRHSNIRMLAPKANLLERPGPYINDDIKQLIDGLNA